MIPDVVQRANVRMVQRRDALGLPFKPFAKLRIERQHRRQHLDRDGALEPGVARFVDLAHAARADRLNDFVRTELRAGREHREILWLFLIPEPGT